MIWSFPNLAVAPGWHYGIYLRAQCPAGQNPLFPSGVELFAQVRQQADWPVLAELSTETGGIMRISDAEFLIRILAHKPRGELRSDMRLPKIAFPAYLAEPRQLLF